MRAEKQIVHNKFILNINGIVADSIRNSEALLNPYLPFVMEEIAGPQRIFRQRHIPTAKNNSILNTFSIILVLWSSISFFCAKILESFGISTGAMIDNGRRAISKAR